MEEFKLALFGTYSWGQLFGFLWFFILGYVLYALDETTNRDKQSARTPIKWSWRFWFFDNWRRYIVTFLTTYLFFRFYTEFTGHELTYFECAMIGMIGDGIGARIKTRIDFVKANRPELLKEEKPENVVQVDVAPRD